MYLRPREAARTLANAGTALWAVSRTTIAWCAADRRRRVVALSAVGIGVVAMGAALAALALRERKQPTTAAAWQYLGVCSACEYRAQLRTQPPGGAPAKCPRCGQPRFTAYRRGSQALIPGGWSTSQPTSQPASRAAVGGGP